MNDIVFVVKVISGNRIFKVVITKQQASEIKTGDKVLITSKAFNPENVNVIKNLKSINFVSSINPHTPQQLQIESVIIPINICYDIYGNRENAG